MDVLVSKKELLRVLARCQEIADRKSTQPILGNVLLTAKASGTLELAATNTQASIAGSVGADVQRPGSASIGARELFERVRMMPEGQIAIDSEDGTSAIIRAVGSARRFTLRALPAADFPALPQPPEGATPLKVEAARIAQLIAATHFSISNDDTRLHLASALFEWDGDRIRMVTTDGHRLTKMEVAAPTVAQLTMLIPHKSVMELKRLCEDIRSEASDGLVEISQGGASAFFRAAGLQFSVKLVDQQFPPYQQVIPSVTDRIVRAPRLAMADALKAVSVAANDQTGGVRVTVGSGRLRFESESPESGAGFDEVMVDYDGGELQIGFNARYFLDVLAAMENDEVLLGVSGPLDPAVLRPADELDGSAYLGVIMPMRI